MPQLSDLRQIYRHTGHNASVFALAPDPDPRFFYSAGGDGWLVRWDRTDPELGQVVAKVGTQVFSLCHLPNQPRMVAGSMQGGVHWIDLADPAKTRNIAHHQKGVFQLKAVENWVFSLGGEGAITRWSASEGRSLETLYLSNQSLRSLAYHPGRRELAVGASDNCIYLLDVDDLGIRHTFRAAHTNSVFCVAYHPTLPQLCSGGRDALLRVWDLEALAPSREPINAHWFTLNTLAFDPSGQWLASGSRDKTIKIWDAQTYQLLKVLDTIRDGGHVNSVNALLWLTEPRELASTGDDRSVIRWGM